MKNKNCSTLLKQIILFVLLWFINSSSIYAQNYLFDVEKIGLEDGLPHRNTFNITQDKEGFIWISTLGGISRYDGYTFKNYNASFLNILESNTTCLAVDDNNNVWYCERGQHVLGASFTSGVINTRKDTLYTIASISKGLLSDSDIYYVANSKIHPEDILIITKSGILYKYNSGNFEELYRLSEPVSISVTCEAAPDGSYWIANRHTLTHIKDGKRLKTIETDAFTVAIKIIIADSDLIVKAADAATVKRRYWKLENDRFVPFALEGYAFKEFTGLFQIHKDYTCYAINDMLFVRDTQGNILYRYRESKSLKMNRTIGEEATFIDRQGTLWMATGDGVLKLNAKKNPFKILELGNSIRGVYQEDQQLWIGGNARNVIENIGSNTQQVFESDCIGAISSFYRDHQNHLWMGTSSYKCIEYIPEEDRYAYYTSYRGNQCFLPFQNTVTKTYWVGTKNGLLRLDKKYKRLTPFDLPISSKGVYIKHYYQNTKGIWLVSNKGIFLMDAKKETIIKHYTVADGLPVANINHLYEDTEGVFWLGTKGGGLVRWDQVTHSFRQYTQKDGLSNTNIYAVYEDDFETLWLPSDYGLMAFDKNTLAVRVYLPQNGIAHEEFNTHAHFKSKDGTLYFGGLNGVTKFHPKDLSALYDTSSPLHINSVSILEEDAEVFTDKTIDFRETQEIHLESSDKIIELKLALLDYEKSVENRYAYKIEGHQDRWVYTNDNTLSIINPPYGNYNLVIKGRGASGNWTDKMLTIPVHMPTPFYRQWWFIGMLIFIAVVAIIVMVKWRLRRLENERKRLEEEVHKRTHQIEKDKETIELQAEELKMLDKSKTRFFSNITHEFRTPLTLVIGPVEQILASPPSPENLRKKMRNILKNAHNLLNLINQLLDISKMENHQMKLEVSHGDIVWYTKDVANRFQVLADKKRITLDFISSLHEWKTHFDKDKWNKILYNLLSNAFKFTPEGGAVTVMLQQLKEVDTEAIQLRVTDTGSGIEAENLSHIFDRFYQVDGSATRTQEGTGIGLSLVKELITLQDGTIAVESTVGKGTLFSVKLPVHVAPTSKDEVPTRSITYPSALVFEELLPENEVPSVHSHEKKEKLQLLIIEDNVEMRAYIHSCIDNAAYDILEAADGEEGVAKAKAFVPDLIISDVMMPKKDGFEVVKNIRGHIATSHIPLILLTAKTSLESRLMGIGRGADVYLTKPFSPQELVLRIKMLIKTRQVLQQRYQNDSLPDNDVEFEKEDDFIRELKDYITNHLSNSELNADIISAHFCMSRMQLYRKLKALLGGTLSGYIRSLRIETAAQLLKEHKLNITEVAYETGFSSLSNFSRTFKKVYGKKPSDL